MADIDYEVAHGIAQIELAKARAEAERLSALWIAETRENERLNGLHSKALGVLAAENFKLKTALTHIHGMTQNAGPDWQIVQNVAATAATALRDAEQ